MNTTVAPPLRIATRKSQLALWQAEHVATLLRGAHAGLQVELVPISTKGDRIQDRSLAAIGGKGLFIKELETALEEHRADIAVHSMKDVPSDVPDGFVIAAVLPRADPRDALITPKAERLADLPRAARVGTSSLRRQAQLLAVRPDLRIEALRGNVDTRLRRLDDGELDAIILACAGLIRLGWESRITARLDAGICLPAVAQGIIGIECRDRDAPTRSLLDVLNHPATEAGDVGRVDQPACTARTPHERSRRHEETLPTAAGSAATAVAPIARCPFDSRIPLACRRRLGRQMSIRPLGSTARA